MSPLGTVVDTGWVEVTGVLADTVTGLVVVLGVEPEERMEVATTERVTIDVNVVPSLDLITLVVT